MASRVHVLQHVDAEGPGHIGWWAHKRGLDLTRTSFHDQGRLPAPTEVDALVVLGGTMGVYDEEEHPWLAREKAFLEEAVDAGVPTFGICLGAQLLADVLGGRVEQAKEREVGWFPVERTRTDPDEEHPAFSMLPTVFEAFHWHGDTFSLPPGATRQASSEACSNQAFTYEDHVIAVQFHLEVDPGTITQLAAASPGDLQDAPYVQSVAEMVEGPERFRTAHTRLVRMLDEWYAT